jgi:hypothetical protein
MRQWMSYSPRDCFRNFPLPQSKTALDKAGDRYFAHREAAMRAERQALTQLYNRVHEQPDDGSESIEELRRSRRNLDRAVADAYGWVDLELDHDFRETSLGLRYTMSEAVKFVVLERLLELNHERYAEEVRAGLHQRGKPKRKRKPAVAANPGHATLFDDD